MLSTKNIRFEAICKGNGPAIPVNYGSASTPFGAATVFWDEEYALWGVQFGNQDQAIQMAQSQWGLLPKGTADPIKASHFTDIILGESSSSNRKDGITLRCKGTPFQISVWKALIDVPFAETWTYQQLARYVGNEKAVRAVGTAVGKNPFAIVIPCHRIVRYDSIGNYNSGSDRKQQIIEWEKEKQVNTHQ